MGLTAPGDGLYPFLEEFSGLRSVAFAQNPAMRAFYVPRGYANNRLVVRKAVFRAATKLRAAARNRLLTNGALLDDAQLPSDQRGLSAALLVQCRGRRFKMSSESVPLMISAPREKMRSISHPKCASRSP